jgi:hypothetical protein
MANNLPGMGSIKPWTLLGCLCFVVAIGVVVAVVLISKNRRK